jgi:NAD+ synthase
MEPYSFDAAAARERLVAAVRDLAAREGFTRVVIGISGGKDSSVAAAICARALGAENVYGLMLPDGEQKDLDDSRRICEALGISHRVLNIGAMHRALLAQVEPEREPEAGEFSLPFSRESDINVGPRLRMTALRYAAQALGARLVGTGNLSEATVGYCTKDGDTSCDFALLGSLTSVEVVQVGLSMAELPAELVRKTPSDGISGVSDEEKLGLRYASIHDYLRFGTSGDPEVDARIRAKERANAHKRRMPPIL